MTARATGIHQDTIRKGIGAFQSGERLPAGSVRQARAGRKALVARDPTLLAELKALGADGYAWRFARLTRVG